MLSVVKSGFSKIGKNAARSFSNSSKLGSKVAVIGAAGGIGQPMSLLLKIHGNVMIEHLALYDLVGTPGVAADLSHCSTNAKVTGYKGPSELPDALKGASVVVIPAGVPRKPGMTRDDLFNTNAGIVTNLARACAEHCPGAFFLVISNPVNSTVPIFSEVLKAKGVYNPQKLMGVTTLDVFRAKTFVAENLNIDIDRNSVEVDVIGGHAGTTIIPLLSQVEGAKFSEDDIKALTHRIQFGGDEVVKAKDGAGSATLSMASAGAHYALQVLDAMQGTKGIRECTFVENDMTDAPFFASPVILGKDGVEKILGFGKLSSFEQKLVDENVPTLKAQAQKGIDFVKNFP
mmetsp:Transcript_12206/g.18257  ORF Transcript_12206/g.18257 Transcript_12206/m.18257 type:complete len:345 (-) Transcript_12206:63-1097(-)|eukprot:CAMPEP_0171452386 /NCGR_PEP_ID=MMETSP0945-20130129/513_1 /TAXON_ID=109269 /ORGANISM="Vaucheria litorea, Strain CCMP2940" /LENGTH=344 /DNA_ID=CAMNT_0011977039 /DNA_START=92 /DNA_END=1126 /DNA_ORIENTATION=-